MSQMPSNITELIAALEGLGKENLNDEYELFSTCQQVFEKLKRLSDFEPSNLKKTIKILRDLPLEIKETEIKELEIGDEKLESKALNKQDLKELLENYEKAQNNSQKERLGKEIYQRTGQKNVKQFIETQKEIALKNAEKLSKLSPEVKEKVIEDLAINKLSEEEDLAQIIEEVSLNKDQDFEVKKLKKELAKRIKNSEKIDDLIQKVEKIRAEIEIEEKAEEIAKITYEKLVEEKIPMSTETREKIKSEILVAWKEGNKVKTPEKLIGIKEAEVIFKETEKATDIFKNENLKAIVNYRGLELEREISQDLRKSGVENETLIKDYVSVVNKLINNPDNARIEENRSDIYNFVQSKNPNIGPGEIERSIDEARFMAKNVVMAPKKFNELINKYNSLREKIGSDKLPKLKEIRVLEKVSALFKESPKLLKLMNGAQRVIKTIEKISNFPTALISKLSGKLAEKLGGKIIEKIGGEAAKVFIREAAKVIAKEGLMQGARTILTSVLGGGSATAASGGTLAGLISAFAAMGPVGQVIAVVAIAIVAIVAIVKPIFDAIKKIKNAIGNFININLSGVKHFISDSLGLGKFAGSVGQFLFDIGAFLVGIPALLGIISFSAIITPVVIFFFLGILTYSLISQNLLSSIVPPIQTGGGYCVLKETFEEGGAINCDQMAPENDFPGINKANFVRVATQWRSGKNYAEECYNDTVNRALCAGINPAYALWAWVHESGASNYSIEDVEDFGIHYIPENKNFNKQITAFLKLDPGSACPELGYWLSFATNYLNGSCDPDEKNPVNGMTGREYLTEMQETWSWISSLPMPANIKVPVAGQNCDQLGDGSDLPITGEYTDENGDTWVCFGNAGEMAGEIPNFEPWDPSIPVPEGCPGRLPAQGVFTQGPFAQSCTHQAMSVPAIDIGAGNGTPIIATHPGVAVLGYDGIYGFYIDVHGKCEGKDFFTRYAHMPPGGYRVGSNQTVRAGEQIGVVNNTGYSTGPHLHYHISGLETNKFGQYLGLTVEQTQQLWGCCGSWNGKYCP